MKIKQKSFLNKSKSIALVAIVFALTLSNSAAFGQHDRSQHPNDKKMEQKTESIVREGKIDLKKIDKNKDGKVFQDQMHWNVISDEAGTCPLCNMKLKLETLIVAKENLKKNGFKVK
jgi:hypothetical protein